jgi:hypothetical protein
MKRVMEMKVLDRANSADWNGILFLKKWLKWLKVFDGGK